MTKAQLREWFSTINFVLPLCGYHLIASLFLPNSVDAINIQSVSQMVTIPYRVIVLIISCLTIFFSLKSKFYLGKNLILYISFWILLLIRIYYDLFIRADFFVLPSIKVQIVLYAFILCFFTVLSIIVSYRYINFALAFKITIISLIITTIALYVRNKGFTHVDNEIQNSGNIGINTLKLAQIGSLTFLLIVYSFLENRVRKFRLVYILLSLMAFYLILISGSRGPVISCIVIFILLLYGNLKNNKKYRKYILIFIVLLIISLPLLFSYLENIAPILFARFELTVNEGNLSGRQILYEQAIELFMQSPIYGNTFAINQGGGYVIYSHNVILDAFMGLGVFGGVLFFLIYVKAVVRSCKSIINRSTNYWVYLLALYFLIATMSSSAIYMSDSLSVLIAFVFLNRDNFKQNIRLNI